MKINYKLIIETDKENKTRLSDLKVSDRLRGQLA